MRIVIVLVVSVGLWSSWSLAQTTRPAAKDGGQKAEQPGGKEKDADHLSVTEHHRITVHGQAIEYKATSGTLVVRDDAGKAIADMFFIAYEKEPKEAAGKRPLTFLFNGGPGSSSVWLHLGAA